MNPVRPDKLFVGDGRIDLPVYFPSVSSVKTSLSPLDYVCVLNALTSLNPKFLVSAFDLVRTDSKSRESLQVELSKARSHGTIVLMDSGNYEAFWKSSLPKWTQEEFHSALRDYPCSIAFGFDEQHPPTDQKQHLKILNERYKADLEHAGSARLVPIIHGDKDTLPHLCTQFAIDQKLDLIAVPERCLGSGIFERAGTVKIIRKQLDTTGRYILLHLLGTGNPFEVPPVYVPSPELEFEGRMLACG